MADLAAAQHSLREMYKLDDIVTDIDGRTLFIALSSGQPFLIWQKHLKYDVFIVARGRGTKADFLGWLPLSDVEEAPTKVRYVRGEAVDYAHDIVPECLNPMPKQFSFIVPCEHDAAYWESDFRAWKCFICDRIYHVAYDRETIKY